MKTLCLYYSRTNMTKEVMENIAGIIGADISEYTDGKDRSGFLGYVGACFATVNNTLDKVTIRDDIDFSEYDRVIIGMPTWVEKPCAIGRALIKKYADRMPSDVYYVVTQMGKSDYTAKIKDMDSLLGRPSRGQFAVRTKDNDYIKDSEEIASQL